MDRKNMQTIVLLIVIVIALVVVLGFFGIGGFSFFPNQAAQSGATPAQQLLTEVQQAGGVTALKAEDISVGTGDPVVAGDTVAVTYTGVLPNGTVFDSTDAHGGQAFTFTMGAHQVIPGWEEGLLGMREGGRRLLAIPPSLGYGANAVGPIPANSTLIFDIQLLKRFPAGATTTSLTASTTAQ